MRLLSVVCAMALYYALITLVGEPLVQRRYQGSVAGGAMMGLTIGVFPVVAFVAVVIVAILGKSWKGLWWPCIAGAGVAIASSLFMASC
jgi:hypothetical protein